MVENLKTTIKLSVWSKAYNRKKGKDRILSEMLSVFEVVEYLHLRPILLLQRMI